MFSYFFLVAIAGIQMFSLAADQTCKANRRHSGQLVFIQQVEIIGIFGKPCMGGLLQVALQRFNWFKVRSLT